MLKRILAFALCALLVVPSVCAFAESGFSLRFEKEKVRIGEQTKLVVLVDSNVLSATFYLTDNGKFKIDRNKMQYDAQKGKYKVTANFVNGVAEIGLTARYKGIAEITASEVVLHTQSGDLPVSDITVSVPIKPVATEIRTKQELAAIKNNLSGNYILMADIVFSEDDFLPGGEFYNDGYGWEPIGSSVYHAFSGTFEGNGYKISGLQILKANYQYLGVFGVNKGVIEGLTVINSTFDGVMGVYVPEPEYSGNDGNINYEDKEVWTPPTGSYDDSNLEEYDRSGKSSAKVGSVCGYNLGEIYTSASSSNVLANMEAGGICGANAGKIIECYFYGEVQGETAGGITAKTIAFSKIENCMSNGTVKGNTAGGIVGANRQSEIKNCLSVSKISAENKGGVSAVYYKATAENAFYHKQDGLTDEQAVAKTLSELGDLRFDSNSWNYEKQVPVLKRFLAITDISISEEKINFDIDGNGVVNVIDLGILKKIVARIDQSGLYQGGDYDGNGEVNVVDLAILKKKVANIL